MAMVFCNVFIAFSQGERCSSDSIIGVTSSSSSARTHASALSHIAVRSYPPSNDKITYTTNNFK